MNPLTFGFFCICLCLVGINAKAIQANATQTKATHPNATQPKAIQPNATQPKATQNSKIVPTAVSHTPVSKAATAPTTTQTEQPSFFRRMWNSLTSGFRSSDSTSTNNNGIEVKNPSLKERIVNKFNSIFGVEEYNPPKDSTFVDRLWLLFKHCFLNLKNLAKIFSS
ncbi:unnamed protein product [Schistosoma turkestanicum]|nr:unnamed protein product [Schistosoma turkestanicum]